MDILLILWEEIIVLIKTENPHVFGVLYSPIKPGSGFQKSGKCQSCIDVGQTGDNHITWPWVLSLLWDKISLLPKTRQSEERSG